MANSSSGEAPRSRTDDDYVFEQLFGGGAAAKSAFETPASESDRGTREYMALFCLAYCLSSGREIPAWVKSTYLDGWRLFSTLQVPDLGSAFGLRARRHLEAMRRQECALGVALHVLKLHESEGLPLKSGSRGPGAFEIVAAHWGVCETDVKKFWRKYRALQPLLQGAENS